MFLSCGDSLFDMFVSSGEGGAESTNIAVNGVVGGSPMNVAFGLARLGHKSAYITKLSSDIFGQRIAQFLDANSVDRSLCIPTSLNTTLAMVETREDGSAQYVFYIHNSADVGLTTAELPAEINDSTRVVHFGSYSTAVQPAADALGHLAARESKMRVISYDPNLRLSIQPDVDVWRSTFNTFAASANLVKASDEDIGALFGENKEDNFVADCFSHGAQLVYITRGPDGGSAFAKDGTHAQVPGVKANVIDTVGAGDTFQASILHWLADKNHIGASAEIEGTVDLQASLEFATRAAAITVSRRGADLPTLADLA